MANRILKDSITSSETLAQLTGDEERIFWRLVAVADDFGRFDGRAKIIRGKALASMLDRYSDADVESALGSMERVGLLMRYLVEDRPYVQIVTWEKHQQKRAKFSKYPAPADGTPAPASNCNQMLADVSREARSETREARSEKPPVVPRAARRGRALTIEYSDPFKAFWSAYPRREGKGVAWEKWRRLGCDALLDAILAAVERQRATEQWVRDGGKFIPHPATWLHGRRWEDEGIAVNASGMTPDEQRRFDEALAGGRRLHA